MLIFSAPPQRTKLVSRIARCLAAGRGASTQFCCARSTISNKGRSSASSARPMQQVVKTLLFQSRILARFDPSRFPSAFSLKVHFSVQARPLWSYKTSGQTPGGKTSPRFYLKRAPEGCPTTAKPLRELQKWITSKLERKDQGRCPPKADGFFGIRTLRTNLSPAEQPGPGGLVGCGPAVRLR